MMLVFQRGATSMSQQYNQDYQMYDSPYIRPEPSPLSNLLLTTPTKQITQLQRHVARKRHFNEECSQESDSFTKPL